MSDPGRALRVPACRAAVRQGYMSAPCRLAAPRVIEVDAAEAMDCFVPVCEGHYALAQVGLVDLVPEQAP